MSSRGGGPSAASRGGGRVTAKNASAPQAMPLDRIQQISILQYDAKMCFDFVRNDVPEVTSFEDDWTTDNLSGQALLSNGPMSFHSVLRSAIPTMTADIRAKVFNRHFSHFVGASKAKRIHFAGYCCPVVEPGCRYTSEVVRRWTSCARQSLNGVCFRQAISCVFSIARVDVA